MARTSQAIDPTRPGRTGGVGKRAGEFRDGTHARVENPTWDGAKNRIPVEELRQPLWELQPNESPKAYAAFVSYRSCSPSIRTQKVVCEKLQQESPSRSSQGIAVSVAEWSARYWWVERVKAYDAWLDTMFLAQQEREIRLGAGRFVARANEIREVEYELAMSLANKVRDMLNWPISRTTRRKTSKDGKTIYLTIIEPARWDFKAAADILARLGYQARLSVDMPTDGARSAAPEPTGKATSDVDAWLSELGASATNEHTLDELVPSE